jgi:hypothetical protein
MRSRVQKDDAHALRPRELAEFRQHDVERPIDFARREQGAIDFPQHLEGAPVPLQGHGREVEFSLERREFFDRAAGQRFEAALAQMGEATTQCAQRRQVPLGDQRGNGERHQNGEQHQNHRGGNEIGGRRAEGRFGREHHHRAGRNRIAGSGRRYVSHRAAPLPP